MALPLEIPPGILKVDSPNAGKGRFIDADKVRFVKKFPQKWAGWVQFNDTTLLGICRGATWWTNSYGNANAAFGTSVKLYALTGGDSIVDITPIRSSGTLSGPFATTNLSNRVTVTDTSHGALEGDYVTFSGATAVGGITINGEYVIVEKTDDDHYVIEHTSNATSTASGGGGASVSYAYQVSTGSEGTTSGLGWGAGSWGEGTWGTARDTGLIVDLRHWSLQPYGNDLLALPSNDTLYLWQELTDSEAEIVSGAPVTARAMFVTGERFVMLLGTTTPMTVSWPDRDDITDWTPAADNTANTRRLQNGSKLMAGTAVSDGVNVVWSDTAAYLFQYTGSEFIYDSRLVSDNCGLVGPLAFAVGQSAAFWMSSSDFYRFAGGVSPIPRSEEIKAFVFRDIDQANIDKTWALYDETTNQVRWHYCAVGSAEPDKYIDVDLGDFSWTPGTLPNRTAGTQFQEATKSTLLVDADGTIYQHGVGSDADGEPMESYITFGLYVLANGDKNVDIMGLVPDCERQVGDLTYELYTQDRPNSDSRIDEITVTLAPNDVIEDLRLQGRHFGMTVRSNVLGGDFRLGIPSLELQSAGDRR